MKAINGLPVHGNIFDSGKESKRGLKTGVIWGIKKELKRILKREPKRGSVTVEAAMAMPVFLCAVLSIVFIIKAVYVYELIQHSLTDTAEELGSLSYLYYKSGLLNEDKNLQEGLSGAADEIGNLQERVRLLMLLENKLSAGYSSGNTPGEAGGEAAGEAAGEVAGEAAGEAAEGAGSYHVPALQALLSGSYDNIKSGLYNNLAKSIIKKYLIAGSSLNVQDRLETLNVRNGFQGLDFSRSRYFSNNNDIELVVSYKLDLPLPVKIFGDFEIVQRATVRAWTGGDNPVPDSPGSGYDIWALDNFTRGRKFREIFGANLPFNFPVISSFENGTAVMIKSMNLSARSYSENENIEKRVMEFIHEMANYEGQEEPWGKSGISIRKEEIMKRQIILIIPDIELSNEKQQLLEECRLRASAAGIELRICRY